MMNDVQRLVCNEDEPGTAPYELELTQAHALIHSTLNSTSPASPRPLGAPQLRPAVQRRAAMHTRSIQARARA